MKRLSLLSAALVVVSSVFFGVPAEAETVRARKQQIPEATCKEFPSSIFKPCICDDLVPRGIKYRVSMPVCGGDAAAVLDGQFASSYSVVLRDSQNRDRWPASGYNNCTPLEVEDGLNKCSAFKCQKTIRRKNRRTGRNQTVCCFGEPGTHPILGGATRMTIKLRDDPTSSNDPLLRVCLNGFDPDVNLN